MLRVAIVGCGKIADLHAAQISHIAGCRIVGVCDREPLMAQQLRERFAVDASFSNLDELFRIAKPDVVHVTTPPESHYAIARACLEAGCHVYVEKPFGIDAQETESLLAYSTRAGLKMTAGHNAQFQPAARRLRALVEEGYLGGAPVHMESYFCYEMTESPYIRALLQDRQHWVRRLPGKLLHNIISHGIAKIAEFLASDAPAVHAYGFRSSFLGTAGETELLDELRVLIDDAPGRTAYFTFSSQMRPALHQFSIYGPANSIVLDDDHETVIKLSGRHMKSYLDKLFPPLSLGSQYIRNAAHNAKLFALANFHMNAGMRYLIDSFYRAIIENTSPPIPYREIIVTARIMDSIFAQVHGAGAAGRDPGEMAATVLRRS